MKMDFFNTKANLISLPMLSFLSLVLWSGRSHADFSKADAYETLRKQGFKWHLIQTQADDADIKVEETTSAFKPKVQLAFKQFVAKINPVQYGLDEKDTLDQVGFGTTGVEFNWTILDPAASSESKLALFKASASKQLVLQNRTDLTALMLFQFLTVQKLKRQLVVMDGNLEKSQLIYKLAKSKNDVGAGIPLDVARARNLHELDRLKKINAFNKYLKAQHDLATTLGLEKIKAPLEPLQTEKMNPNDIRSLFDQALATRADLKSAELSSAAANEFVTEIKKSFFPKLTLVGEVGTTQATAFGFPARQASGLIGIELTIPLESGGLIHAKKREALSLQNKADLQLQQTRLEVLSQIKEALEQILSTEEALTAAESYVETVKEETNIAEKRFSHGSSNILDYTSSHNNLATAQDTLTDAMFNLEAAKLNYYRTLGSFDGYFRENK
jgi:outer membrane protein TolC